MSPSLNTNIFFAFVGERKKNETLQRKLESTQEELMRTLMVRVCKTHISNDDH